MPQKTKETLKIRGLEFKIYETSKGTWKGYGRFSGKRYDIHRTTKHDCIEQLKVIANEIGEIGVRIRIPSQLEYDMLQRAKDVLAPFDINILEAAKYYAHQHRGIQHKKSVHQVASECLKSKSQDGLSSRYVKTLKVHFNKLCGHFGMKAIADISTPELDRFLRSLNQSSRTRNNMRNSMVTLWKWAEAQRYVAINGKVAESISRAKSKGGEIHLLSPEEMSSLMDEAAKTENAQLIAYFTIGGFAGIRTAEMERLIWSDIGEDHIEVASDKAKTASRRIVPISPNLSEWLKKIRGQHDERVCPKGVRKYVQPVCQKLKIEWKPNFLRHSFISYRVAQTQNVPQVALEAGNSPAKIFSNYRSVKLSDGRLITQKLAEQWFSICP
jgi:integrase